MQQFPLISVVLATYNGERFLEAQLDSIVQQTYPNLEVVAIDDCSTDATATILARYAIRYPFVRVVVNETNLGYVRNFEKGMLLAAGDYIAPSDQDDIWHLDKIRVLAEALDGHEIVYADSRLIDGKGHSIGENFSDVRKLISFSSCLSFVIGNTVSGHGMLINRDLIYRSLPFPASIPHDHWMCFVATFRKPIRFVPQLLVDYRQHTNNVFGITRMIDGVRRPRQKKSETQKLHDIRQRIQLLYEKCPTGLAEEKQVLATLTRTYNSFSPISNFVRMMTFFRYRDQLLATKKRSAFRKWLFCLKMFVKIR